MCFNYEFSYVFCRIHRTEIQRRNEAVTFDDLIRTIMTYRASANQAYPQKGLKRQTVETTARRRLTSVTGEKGQNLCGTTTIAGINRMRTIRFSISSRESAADIYQVERSTIRSLPPEVFHDIPPRRSQLNAGPMTFSNLRTPKPSQTSKADEKTILPFPPPRHR